MDPKREHIFRSKLPDIHIPNYLPIHTYCFQSLDNHRSHPALVYSPTGQVFTHAQVYDASRKLAAGFHSLGIRQGDVIMLVLQNSPEFVFAFLASSFLGATTTTANPLYTSTEIASQARISKPNLIITHAQHVEKVARFAHRTGVKIISVEPLPEAIHFYDLMKFDENQLPEVKIEADDTAVLPFSSGTTGLPKGVMLSHKNVVTCVSQKVDGDNPTIHFDCDDVTLCVLPMFHIYCLMAVLLSSLRVGSSVLIMPKYEINDLLVLIQRYRVTIVPLVPPVLLALSRIPESDARRIDLESVRRVVCGAAPMDGKLQSSVRTMFPNAVIGQGYGMTETGVVSMCLGFAKRPLKFKSGSCGSVVRNSQVKVVDLKTGLSLSPNHVGEILVKSDAIMKGYLNDPDATKRMIDKDGWLHTGDIGYFDDDEELFIVDRLKELIKYKGFHVAPAELEALLMAHPCISDAAVVPMKDDIAGEVPIAFVVRISGSNISEQEIKQYISNQVVSYKRINRVFFINEVPKSPAGKILRKNLRPKM